MTAADEAGRLYLALGRVNRALRREAVDAPVGHGALSVVATLVEQGPQRLGPLAATEGISPPSLTRIVQSLEQLGHVRRTADPADRRATIVEATSSGREVLTAGRQARLGALRDRLERLPEADRATLRSALPVLEHLAAPAERDASDGTAAGQARA